MFWSLVMQDFVPSLITFRFILLSSLNLGQENKLEFEFGETLTHP